MADYPETTFSPELVDAVGGIGNVLAEFLDKQIEEIQQTLEAGYADVGSNTVGKVIGAFITLEGTKRPIRADQLVLPRVSAGQVAFCLDRLEKARILRLEDGIYELAHDTLARHIADQRSAEEVAFLEIVKLVKDRFRMYHTTSSLLNANELHLVGNYRKRLEEEERLSEDEWDYVERSRRDHRRRRLIAAGVVSAVILVLTAISIFSGWQYLNAVQAQRVAQKAQLEAQNNLEQLKEEQAQKAEAQYREHLARGRILMSQADYVQAIQEFETALAFREDGEEALSLKSESESKSGVKERFDQLIGEGDRLFDQGASTYIDALERYRRALATGYDNALANNKISVVGARLESAFEKFRQTGDTFYAAGGEQGYRQALSQYRQALRIKPNDAEILRKVEACREELGE